MSHVSTSRGQKPNFLFRSSFDMKLKPPGSFFDALNRSAIDFYLGVQFGVKFSKLEALGWKASAERGAKHSLWLST